MKKEIITLKIASILVALVIVAIAVILVPDETDISDLKEGLPLVISVYLSFATLLFALFQTYKLLNCISKGKAFSKISIKILEHIKHSSLFFSLLYAVHIPTFYLWSEMEDAPGVLAIGLIFTLTPIIIAVFTSLLSKIVLEFKSSNNV